MIAAVTRRQQKCSDQVLFLFSSLVGRILVMDLNLENHNLYENNVRIIPPKIVTKRSNKCKQREFTSSYASGLRRHLKTHSGEKSNKCNQCDFASIQVAPLRTHLKTHSGEKSHECNQCDYASSRADNLRRH